MFILLQYFLFLNNLWPEILNFLKKKIWKLQTLIKGYSKIKINNEIISTKLYITRSPMVLPVFASTSTDLPGHSPMETFAFLPLNNDRLRFSKPCKYIFHVLTMLSKCSTLYLKMKMFFETYLIFLEWSNPSSRIKQVWNSWTCNMTKQNQILNQIWDTTTR